ncbi:hypothetical protein ACRAWB_12170 [Leifsonia poae]|uniref:hypothetical protein n=1 Tax=Leifsonia poae TaxID=110933 RepID=UPI003D69E798
MRASGASEGSCRLSADAAETFGPADPATAAVSATAVMTLAATVVTPRDDPEAADWRR